MHQQTKRKGLLALVFIAVLVIGAGLMYWDKCVRDVPQPGWIAASDRDTFLYGSTGAERTAGIPYWIWLVLPRVFPEYLRYPGGYAALGLRWEEGREMPAGFSKKTVGYARVAANCALCHARSYRTGADAVPQVVAAIPGHATDLQPLFTFLKQCALDPRFNAKELMAEINMATHLSMADKLIYRFILIPRTRQALLDQTSVILDPTLRAHGLNPGASFSDPRLHALEDWVKRLRAPEYPLSANAVLVSEGQLVFAEHCATCHALDANGTATRTNGGNTGPALSGIWLRGPYLHNGSVPSVRDLLEAPAQRPSTFFQGSDVIDPDRLGFLSTMEEEPGRHLFGRYDTTQAGHSNAGHLYGTGLSRSAKDALLEYLKKQ